MRPAEGTGVPHLDEDEAALAGLGEPLGAVAHQHLADCERCRAEVAGWARLGAARAAEDVEALAPPAGTWDRIAHEVGFGEGTPTVAGPTVVQTVAAPLDEHRRTRRPARRRRFSPAVAAAAVAGLLVGGVLGVVGARTTEGSDPVAVRPAVVSSATLRPVGSGGASDGPGGTAEVADQDGAVRLHLAVHGVQAPAQGYLEAWLLDADGGMVSLGTMAGDDMTVTVPAGIDLSRFDVVDVSREPLDGNPGHSSDSVLRGTLSKEA
ncbi:anti-sigma factor [Kineococcus sp. NPDC059986]|uniref:anti-sigma factor n=1 Tax=Kineococcus sp. NPDC059986 TaxID=3155538 RepID=UPI0034507D5A